MLQDEDDTVLENARQLGDATKIRGMVITRILINPPSLKQIRMPSSSLPMFSHLSQKCKNQFQTNWHFREKSLAASFPISKSRRALSNSRSEMAKLFLT